jgi:Transposase
MTNPTRQPSARQVRQVIVGVDTHKHVHVAVALTDLGAILGQLTIPADHGGYTQLAQWATTHGRVVAFGVEGTGSYGAGLASYLHRCGHRVIEVNRPDRRVRRQRGKTDPIDAENAARAVLAGTATATPKHADGAAEMLRQLKIARDTAVKARTQAMITLKALVVTAPAELRERWMAVQDGIWPSFVVETAPKSACVAPPRPLADYWWFSEPGPETRPCLWRLATVAKGALDDVAVEDDAPSAGGPARLVRACLPGAVNDGTGRCVGAGLRRR